MAGKCSKALLVVVAALALTASASAASPDVAAMNLQPADVPGAKVVNQHAVKQQGYLAAHFRSFVFAAPAGSAHLVGIESETALAANASKASSDASAAERAFRSKAGRAAFVAVVAKQFKVKVKAVSLGQPHKVAGFDQGFEVATSVGFKAGRIYENLVVVRLDRVLVQILEGAQRPIGVATTAKYTTAIAGHIGTELAPATGTPPTIAGSAQQGQTLTASPGTWTAPDATFGYQWQHCDATGAACVDVSGATAATYAVTETDVGTTLRVVVTATNRFGSAPATSAQTGAVT
jgi:hypothetical protein